MLTVQSRLRWAISLPKTSRLVDALTAARAPLLFSVRLWASVCLALFIAFWLELDNPFWAGTSAAIVCYPQLGASLRKGWFRMIGTVIGATMIVVLTAWFPQDRIAFLCIARPLGRHLRFRRLAAPQLRILLGGTRGLHRGNHRRRQPRCNRRAECRRFPAGGLARQRDLHRNCVRRYRAGRDRSRRRPPTVSPGVRQSGCRGHKPVYPHVGAGWPATAGHAERAARTRSASHRA